MKLRGTLLTLGFCLFAICADSVSAAPPTIVSTAFTASTTTATLIAEVNPGGKASLYHFEYGSADCSANPCTAVPIPEGKITSGTTPVAISAEVSGLVPATVYHFRFAVKNSESGGYLYSPDRVFAIFAPSQPGLPDGRAYEQVSPVNKNGGDASAQAYRAGIASTNGDSVSFQVLAGIPGAVGAQDFPIYLSRRDSEGWSTAGVLPPPTYSTQITQSGWTPDLEYFFPSASLIGSDAEGGIEKNLLARESAGGSIEQIIPFTEGATYRLAGASTDDSKLFLEAGAALTPEAAPGKPNLYLYDRDTSTLSLAGILPDSECAAAPCVPLGGSFAGAYDWWSNENQTQSGGARARLFTEGTHALSESGDRAYFTAGGGQLYLRQDPGGPAPSTLHVSASEKTNGTGPGGSDGAGTRPAAFMGASADGSKAFFASAEKLTDDATTGPEPTPPPPPAIGRTDLEGKSPQEGLIPDRNADGMAVDGSHLYWADSKTGAIGRSNLEGGAVEANFIADINPVAVAVDGGHLYWADPKAGTIGRANLEGNELKPDFITGAASPRGVAVDSEHLYWTNHAHYSLGRAKIDGTAVEQDFRTLCTCDSPSAIVVGFDHLIFSFIESGRAGIQAMRRDESGINGWSSSGDFHFETPGLTVSGLAIDENYVYWSVPQKGWIGREAYVPTMEFPNEVDQRSFVEGLSAPTGLAVNASHIYYSSVPVVPENPGNDLYGFEPEEPAGGRLTDLTPDLNPSDPNGAEVQGVLGTSADGSYVYFGANGDLDASGAAEAGDCEKVDASFAASGTCNLYLSHAEQVTFIAKLDVSGTRLFSDALDWAPRAVVEANAEVQAAARVSADGKTLVFRSQRQLTGYDNDSTPEYYRFHLGDPLVCITCSPIGAPPTGPPTLQSIVPGGVSGGPVQSQETRALSADGDHFFFETPDKLVPADTNGEHACPRVGPANNYPACQDVYEWQPSGFGSCSAGAPQGGCYFLISSGQGSDPSFLADASASGEDVFFFTRSSLVGQDLDQLLDLYDARVGGGLASQNLSPTPPVCESADACHGAVPAVPTLETPGSVGSFAPNPKPHRCKGSKVRRGKRCVKPHRRGQRGRHGHKRRQNQIANRKDGGR